LGLGCKIFPESEELRLALKARMDLEDRGAETQDAWRARIAELYTPEQWIGLSRDERNKLKIGGHGLKSLAAIFGTPGNPVGYNSVHYLLGSKIFPESKELLHLAEVENRTPEEWRARIRAIYSPEAWIAMSQADRSKLRLDGVGLRGIAAATGDNGNVIGSNADYYLFAEKLFPENEAVRAAAVQARAQKEIEKRTPAEWLKRLSSLYTPEGWISIGAKKREQINVDGAGLYALETMFGIENPSTHDSVGFYSLGLKIFPENTEMKKLLDIAQRSPEDWRLLVRTRYTREDWVNMRFRQKKSFNVDGLGLRGIAGLFGLAGDPIGDSSVYQRLLDTVFPTTAQ